MTERETALERAGERARETRVNTAREGGREGVKVTGAQGHSVTIPVQIQRTSAGTREQNN